jgi:hypothetical protein
MNKTVLNTSTSLSTRTDNVLDATEFAGANYWKGAEIDRRHEVTLTSAGVEEFKKKDGTIERKLALGTSEGRKLVMGPTKTKLAMRVYKTPNALLWIGQRAIIFPSTTVFSGEIVPAVGFEPLPPTDRLAAPEQAKVIEHDGPPPPPATEYDDPNMVPEDVEID